MTLPPPCFILDPDLLWVIRFIFQLNFVSCFITLKVDQRAHVNNLGLLKILLFFSKIFWHSAYENLYLRKHNDKLISYNFLWFIAHIWLFSYFHLKCFWGLLVTPVQLLIHAVVQSASHMAGPVLQFTSTPRNGGEVWLLWLYPLHGCCWTMGWFEYFTNSQPSWIFTNTPVIELCKKTSCKRRVYSLKPLCWWERSEAHEQTASSWQEVYSNSNKHPTIVTRTTS